MYAVEVPEGTTGFEIDNPLSPGDLVYYKGDPCIYSFRKITLPPGSWQLIGTVREVTRSNAAELCEWFELAGKKGYRDYSFTDDLRYPFLDPISSWRSLLKAKTLDTNKN